MQINPTNNLTPLPGPRRVTGSETPPAQDAADFSTTDSIRSALRNAADVRPDEVERARSLIDTSIYPPEETIRKIANLMAMSVDWRGE